MFGMRKIDQALWDGRQGSTAGFSRPMGSLKGALRHGMRAG